MPCCTHQGEHSWLHYCTPIDKFYIRTKSYLQILLLNFDCYVQRPASEKETLVSVRAVEADVTSVPPVVMQTTPTSTNITERTLEPESRETTELSQDGGVLSTGNQDANYSQVYTPDDAPSNADKIRLDEAATMAQAAFRGYLVIFVLFYYYCCGYLSNLL